MPDLRKMWKYKSLTYGGILIIVLLGLTGKSYSQACDPTTPSFTFDLSGHPDSIWISPEVVRTGLCCGLDPTAKPPIRCVEFFFTLDTAAEGIRFDIASGAIPPGALGYQINCGPMIPVGGMICLSGPGPHRLTFCKPGNNPNTYSITSIPKPKVSKPTVVSDACRGIMTATGYDVTTIQWTSVPYNATYNSYLSCTSQCATTTVTYQTGAPPYIDYQVSGYPLGGCNSTLVTNITRVYFVNDKAATIQPQDPVICFGGTNATITAYGTGGAPPYTYKWSTGETTQSINVGIGTYWVEVSDTTSCPTARDTVTVTAFLSPITANAGPDVTSCANNPTATLTGSVYQAQGGIWSGGNGTYAPYDTSLTATYTPTAAEITSGKVRHILTTTGNRNCPPSYDTTYQAIVPSPVVNAGPDKTVCANNAAINLTGTVSNAGGGTWSGGTGTFSPDPNSLNITYTPSPAEIASGTVSLTLTSTGNGTCNPVSDQVVITITPSPVVNAGPDQTICANNATASLSGSVAVATGGVWSGGSGTFAGGSTALANSYKPSSSEITSGSVTLTLTTTGNGNCLPVSDQMVVTITPAPTVDAGPDQSVCRNNMTASLNGTVTVAGGGVWTGGSGTFSPNANTLNASYVPSAAESAAGMVTLTLTTTLNGNCLAVSDKVTLLITPAPVANAGPDRTVCANNATLALAGTVSVATGGVWSGGAGSFSPDASALNATYTPSVAEITSGSVTLTLTTTGNGTCIPVSDQMVVTITPAPVVNAGPDQSVCFNNSTVTLAGSVTGAGGGKWTGGSGAFSPNDVTLSTQYFPSATEKTAGSLTLTLTSTANGNCLPVSDQVNIAITPPPVADAGPDVTICANNASASLSGSLTVAGGGVWTGGAGTFSPDANTMNAVYTPTATEIANGTVILTLTSTGNGNCIPVSDKMIVTITPAPTVSAGSDQQVCGDASSVSLNGIVTIAGGGTWTTSGTGNFSPGSSALNATYTPSVADTTAGSVTLTLTSTGNGNCIPVSDALTVTFTDLPSANAGPDQTVCTNNFPIQLNATGNPGIWSGGGGTFNPDPSAMNATYIPSGAEVTATTVTLTFTTTSNGACPPVSDNVTITIPPGPTANAGSSMTVCADTAYIDLNGIVTFASGGTWSSTGTGSFSPDPNQLQTTYIPSAADTSAGSVVLTLTSTGNILCNPPATDKITVAITPAPSIDAGPDVTVCADTSGVQVTGAVSVASGGIWTSAGTGSFTPGAGLLQTTYVPSAADTTAGSVTLTLRSTGNGSCKAVSDQVTLTITPVPVVDAGLDQTLCADFPSATLTGAVYNASGGIWTSSGTGVFSPDPYSMNAIYYPSAADRATGTVNIFLTSTGNKNCKSVSESSLILSITPAPTANAGPDQTVCADTAGVSLNGIVTVATTGRWTTSGTGSFLPHDSALTATYVPSAADIAGSAVTITLTTTGSNCVNVSDQMLVKITPAPTVDAGPDQTVCGNNTTVSLLGNETVATGGTWSGGTGTFPSGTSGMSVTYIPSALEIASGGTKLFLTTTGNGSCKPVTDTVDVIITPAPVAAAGPDQTLCMDASEVTLSGTVTVAGGGSWTTSGSGIFDPSAYLTATGYLPTSADKTSGQVRFILTTTNNGNCLPVQDTMYVNFSEIPTVDAGPADLCSDVAGVQLSGTVTVAATGTWTSSGTGTFSPSDQILNPVYTPSAADRAAGSVILRLTATTCKSISDSIVLNVIPAPIANAGPDQTVCANNGITSLAGTVSNAGGGLWSSSGGGNFAPSANDLNASYTPSAADISKGTVLLTLVTTGNGKCKAKQDTMLLAITPAPAVSAGPDQTVCADIGNVNIGGTVTVSSGGIWTSSGSGTFTSGNTALTTSYTPSPADRASGFVTLKLTSTGNGKCLAVADELILSITPAPTVNAGPDITACEDVNDVAFYGTTTVATGGLWTASGSGTFNNPNTLQTIYTITAADKTAGTVQLILTTTGNGTCRAVKDTVMLYLTRLPSADAGLDQTVCNGNQGVSLNGTISGASGGTWSSSGNGSFTPSASLLDATYVPTPQDTTAGLIRLYLTTNVIGGCAVFDSLDISFIDPKLHLPDHYCFEKNLLIDSDPSDTLAGGTFRWYRNDTTLASQNNSTLTVNRRGIYKVTYTFDQCTITDSTNITLPIDLTSSDKVICAGGSTSLSTTTVPKGTYVWTHRGNPYGTNAPVISVTDDGDPMYMITVIDSLLCESKDTAYARTVPPPVMTLTNIPSCAGQSVTLMASPSNNTDPANSLYRWYRNNIILPDTTENISVTSTGSYKVIYLLGECSAADSSVVTFYPLPVPNNKDFVHFCKETDIRTTIDAGAGAKFFWTVLNDSARVQTVSDAGYYPVKIYNEYNCYVTDSILVKDICPPRVFVPTVFTPNGDNRNDKFDISGAHFKNYTLTIFNRWGEVIFYTEDRNISWNGIYREELMPVGVYPWIVTYEGEFEEFKGPYTKQGSVTLSR